MIYICIPTHNEQQTVGVVLWKLRQVLTEYPRDYQLLVADDASTDKTQEVLEPYTRVLPLTVIRCDRRQGHAASLEMLLREASRRSEYPKRDVIVTLQADFSEEPDDLVALLKRLEAGADVAVGTKVAAQKQPFARRFARKLSGFFVRGQKWPEGVSEPFDSFRAYRLYAVKKAIEDRGGRRLLRFDGWATHAELLRAVLPHARRVDVVDVEDRSDRKQRPSRERPMAAALQVRSAMRETDPADLVPVAELDRLAATASRTRDAAAANGNGRRSQGTAANGQRDSRSRERGRGAGRTEGRRDEGRSRGGEARREEGRSRGGDARRGGGESRRGQGEARAGEPQARRGDGESRRRTSAEGGRPQRENRQRGERKEGQEWEPRQRQPRPESPAPQAISPAADADLELLGLTGLGQTEGAVVEAGEGAEGAEGAPKKRRRRRRGRGGSKRAAGTAADGETSAAAGDPDSGDVGEAGDEGESGGDGAPEGERKRRRRGGRRGGRGRKRRQPGEASAEGDASNGSGSDGVEPMAGANAAPPPEARSDQE